MLDLTSPDQPPFTPCTANPCPSGTDFTVVSGSGSGNVTAPLVAVGPFGTTLNGVDNSHDGCSTSDFANFPKGAIALISYWFCSPTVKVANALLAGAAGVVMFNQGSLTGTGVLTDGPSATTIPVVGTSTAVGQQLVALTHAGPVRIHLVTNTTNSPDPFSGAENNTLMNNTGSGNAERDGRDDNPNCDNNHWVANMFGTVNQPCVKAGGGIGQVKPTA